MIRSALSKVMWVGRATVFLVGLAVILAFTVGVVSKATAHTGSAGVFHLAHSNAASALSSLVGSVSNGMLQVTNNSTDNRATGVGVTNKSGVSPAVRATNSGGGPALGLNVASGKSPMTVNSAVKVNNLNADRIDNREASSFAGTGHKHPGTDINSGTVEADRIEDGSGSNLNADQLDGQDSTEFLGANQKAADADKLDGKDFSAFSARNLSDPYSTTGPLPKEWTYTSKGGTVIISVAGSGFRSSGNTTTQAGYIGMWLDVDGQDYGTVWTYANEQDSHRAFVGKDIVVGSLPAGQHTIRLEPIYQGACGTATESSNDWCTTTDSRDSFSVTVMEIPT